MINYAFASIFALGAIKFGLMASPWICGIFTFGSLMFASLASGEKKETTRLNTAKDIVEKNVEGEIKYENK